MVKSLDMMRSLIQVRNGNMKAYVKEGNFYSA